MSKKVKVASIGDALKAGFIPKGDNLENKNGVSVSRHLLQDLAGKVVQAELTGNKDYPAIVEGTILPKELVHTQVGKDIEFKGGKFNVYADGSVESLSGDVYESDFIAFLTNSDSESDNS